MDEFQSYEPVFAVYPTWSGFGWVLFDKPDAVVEWGLASARQGRKLRLVNRFKRLIERHRAAVLVMEEAGDGTRRAERIRNLCREFARAASGAEMKTAVYRREAVSAHLGLPPRASRYDVAKAVALRLNEFAHRLPRKATAGASEDPRQSLFSAAALALTYFADHDLPLPSVHPGAPE